MPRVMGMIKLMGKRIDPDNMEILYDVPFTEETVARDFEIRDGSTTNACEFMDCNSIPWAY